MRGGSLVTPVENVVFGHYLTKYRLLQMGFSWSVIDNIDPKEMDIMILLYSALMQKDKGFG